MSPRDRQEGRCLGRKFVCTAAVLSVAAVTLPAAATASERRGTSLTSNAPAAASTQAPITIEGRLTGTGGKGVRHERVGLYWEPSGTKRFRLLHISETNSSGRYSFTFALGAGSGRLEVRFAGSRNWRRASSIHKIRVATPPATTTASSQSTPTTTPTAKPPPSPTPAPTTTVGPPSATPPPPPPPPPAEAPTGGVASTTARVADDADDIDFGEQNCEFGQIYNTFPLVGAPTGTWVFTIDQLWAIPTDGSRGWAYEGSGDYYYNGTYGPVFDWYDDRSNAVGAGGSAMDVWNIYPGWTTDIVQWVWDGGVWYKAGSLPQPCAF